MFLQIFIAGIVILITILICRLGSFLYRWSTKRHNVPPDVVILYQIGRGPFAPSVSPFPLKLETFLRMTKTPYVNDHSGKFSSKRKTPWIEYDGKSIADSQFCIDYIKKKRGVDVNGDLSPSDQAVARAFQKMTEENLYWTMCIEMFGEDTSTVEKVIPYKGLKLWLTIWFLKRVIKKETWGHGIGRHTQDEVWTIAVDDMTAISNFLGNKEFFMGSEPSEVDCAMFGMLSMIILNMPNSKHDRYVRENLPNIVRYCERMKQRFWPDWESHILTSSKYENDDGKIYFKSQEEKTS
ncbi:failed axon connections homolog [Saccostrea echinata]|uniref:failed axon connections homolog n=1 Tax=Saccostrea echinata TaxID=191078 RepID=UPI002A7FD044|nr:failed axon connections homolog [Saccostrea echinata]